MARLPYLDKKDVTPDLQHMLENPGNVARLMMHSPKIYQAMLGVGQHLRHRSKLNPRLREMTILQVVYTTQGRYEWARHLRIRHANGVSDDDVRALLDWNQGRPTKLDELTIAALTAAREMTAAHELSDATYKTLSSHLDPEQLIELLVAIGYYNALGRVLAALKIDIEDDVAHFLTEFPLPSPR